MNSSIRPAFLILLASLWPGSAVVADEPPALSHNPFSRPPSAITVPILAARRPLNPAEEPILLATMVASRDKLANVDGRILRPGDEIYGYKLVQVFENRAVFERQGGRLTVYVKPHLEEDNE